MTWGSDRTRNSAITVHARPLPTKSPTLCAIELRNISAVIADSANRNRPMWALIRYLLTTPMGIANSVSLSGGASTLQRLPTPGSSGRSDRRAHAGHSLRFYLITCFPDIDTLRCTFALAFFQADRSELRNRASYLINPTYGSRLGHCPSYSA